MSTTSYYTIRLRFFPFQLAQADGISYYPEYEKESHVIVEPRTAREWLGMEEKEKVKR